MSTNTDPKFLLSQAKELSASALKLAQEDKYSKSIDEYKKSNRILTKIVLNASDLNQSKVTKKPSGPVSKKILKQSYLLLGENYENLKKLYVMLDDKDAFFKYLKKSEEYLSNYLKLSNNPDRYRSYLSNLFTTAVTFEKFDEPERSLEYTEKYIRTLFKAIKEGMRLDETTIFESQIGFSLYTNLVKSDLSLMKEGIELLLETVTDIVNVLDSSSAEDIYIFDLWLPFTSQILSKIAQENPDFISDNEELFIKTLNYVKESFLNIVEQETGEKKLTMSIIALFSFYSNLFKDINIVSDLYNMEADMHYALIQHDGEPDEIIGALSNLIDVMQENQEIASNYTLVRLYTRLIEFLGYEQRAETAIQFHDNLLSLLNKVKAEDILATGFEVSEEDIEDDFNLTNAEAYYFLACIEGDLDNYKEAREYINKAKEFINEIVDMSYSDGDPLELKSLIDRYDKELSLIE